MRAIEPDRTITSIKRLMGQPGRVGPGGLLPEEVSAQILKRLKALAERVMGTGMTRAVVTVPAYFNDSQRKATQRAGELAGFHVERLLNEPTAAALAYGLARLADRSRVAVYDLGGGTFDISVLELRAGIFEVLATAGDTRLGGDDIDDRLAAHFREFDAQVGDDARRDREIAPCPSAIDRARLIEAAVTAKHALSDVEEHVVALPFLGGGGAIQRPHHAR